MANDIQEDMYNNGSNGSYLIESTTSFSSLVDEDALDHIFHAAGWVHLVIRIIGLITNPMILLVLRRHRVGSEATRVILMSLAIADMGSLLCNIFITLVPNSIHSYWTQLPWTDASCGIADVIISATLTSSSWFIVLVTLERLSIVSFPLKVKHHYTRGKAVIVCSLMPIFWMMVYSWYGNLYEAITSVDGGVICFPKESKIYLYNASYEFWCILYLFIPAFVLLILNIAIIVQLKRAQSTNRSMTSISYTHTHDKAKRQISTETASSGISVVSTPKQSTANSTVDSKTLCGTNSANKTANRNPATQFKIRKAVRIVLGASIVFIVLMLPKAVVYLFSKYWDPESVKSNSLGDITIIIDIIASMLQYSNHSINFFVYVLANNKLCFKR